MRAALYLRLSREDGENAESESIAAQRLFLTDYCEKEGFSVWEVYVDDGFSGTNFERPSFLRMMRDAQERRFDTIITKDMSRLGRDYIGTGEYIERIFPSMGIRYIAVSDGVDTEKSDGAYDLIPFRAVLNDLYARDVSRKVRVSLTARRRAGLFIGSSAPYGYRKDPEQKGKLIPDERCADTVRRIYRDFLAGKSMRSIAKSLTEEGVLSPSAMKDIASQKGCAWNGAMIGRILQNPTYRGDLTQGFVRAVSYKVKKRTKIPREGRITVTGTHEPLVDGETFFAVQNKIAERKKRKQG